MPELKWQDPPTHGNGRHDWNTVAEQLKEKPGQWALLATPLSTNVAVCIRRGQYKAFRPVGAFEARCTNTKNGRADIYARYVGGDN